jgi:ATP-dependent protease ClpP protease subunit
MGDINIFGPIGPERNEIGFNNVKAQLDAAKDASEIALHIWSPGGDVMEGEAIYNLLKNSGKKITTYVEGTTASIATLIAGAGEKIIMNETARWMIHNPKISGLNTQADARDLRHVANQLDKIKTLLIDVYDKKTALGKPKLWELYDNETWYTAQEAKKAGFVDEVVDAQIRAVAKIDLKKYQMKNTTLIQKIRNLLNVSKIENEMMETLSDDRTIIVQTEDEDWTGKPVFYEDGTPLPPGTYQLKSGKSFTVAQEGVIETVQATAPEQSTETTTEKPAEAETQEMKVDPMKELESLKAQNAELLAANQALQAQVAQSQGEATQAKAQVAKIQNRLSMVEKDFMELQTEASKTFGDTTEPNKGPVIKNLKKDEPVDHMGTFARDFYKNRNLIND